MAHFAELDLENPIAPGKFRVLRNIVIEPEVLATGKWGDPKRFVQNSYNTVGGVHRLGGTPLRKNYPGPGYIYDSVRDAFYAPQSLPSWVLNEKTCLWEPPIPMPADGKRYEWDEKAKGWRVLP